MYGHRLIRELLGLLFIFCGLLLLLSLWSYDPADPTFNQAVTIEASDIRNSAGLFGAFLSGFFVDLIGVASYLWVIFFLAVGAAFVSRWLVLKWYRWIGYVMLFACLLMAASAWHLSFHGIYGGGLAGDWLSTFSFLLFRPIGSMLVWTFVFLAGMELAFSISWLGLAVGTYDWISSKVRRRDAEGDTEEEETPRKRRFASLAEILSRRRQKEEEPERPVLDIILEKDEPFDVPLNTSGVIALPLTQEPSEKENTPEYAAENASGVSDEELARLFSTEEQDATVSSPVEIVSMEHPSSEEVPPAEEKTDVDAEAGERSSKENDFSDGSESSAEIVLEKADIVNSDHSSAPEGIVPSAEEFGAALESALEEDLPLVLSAREHENPFPLDAEYASVDTAVARAMEEQDEIEAASQPGEMEENIPSFILPRRCPLSLPPMDLLEPLPEEDIQSRPDPVELTRQGDALITCLKNFNVHATLARITPGPVVTMFEVRPAPGVKATRITNLANDLAMSLKAVAVRMQAPVPGTDTVGVEVPNDRRSTVRFREIVENDGFRQAKSLLTVALGKDTGGRPVSADLAKMPHLLVAGATGAGKSVCLNAIILSLLYRARPDEVQMILVDPKQVELSMYADLPHLVHPVVTDMDITKNALLWAIDEMNRRLKVFSTVKVRNITGFNERQARLRAQVDEGGPIPLDEDGQPENLANMPFLVIIVDELADLMMVKRKEVEGSIVRLAQLARAAGIHLIIATQRPSVDVVTGLIKANFPCRIAFKVTSGQDSRTILDLTGAEKLLGMGDMLFKPNGGSIQRLHGAFVSDEEVSSVVEFWKKQQKPNYQVDFSEFGSEEEEEVEDLSLSGSRGGSDIVDDPIYAEAVQFVLESGKVSISLLQRRFRIGFNRAARFVEQMEKDGMLSQADGTRPRSVVHR